MRFILRKYVDAETAKDALKLDRKTPVHDCYLRDGEEPKHIKDSHLKDAIGFSWDIPLGECWDGEPYGK
jgi:hypothetical protein